MHQRVTKMKTHYTYQIASNILLFPTLFFLILVFQPKASCSAIDNFLECLPSHSNSSHPISEAIYTRTNSSYSKVLQAYIRESRFNRSSTPKPLAIVTALDVSHVQATVICAKANGLQVRIRSGGHDYEGFSYVSYVPFVVLDMFNLRSIDIDVPSETAWVQAGATIGELYYKIGNKSKVHGFPAGACFTLGTGGHFSGGGYGSMLRKHGLTIDNIIDAQVVDANGRILSRESMGEDLFWAIRGGGAASFCIVLSWKIKLVRVPEIVSVFQVSRTLEEGGTNIVVQWQQVATTIDRKLFIRVQPQVSKQEGNKTISISFIGYYLGRAKSLMSLINKKFPLLSLQRKDLNEMTWVESTIYFYLGNNDSPIDVLLERTPTSPHSYSKSKSDYVKTPIPREGLETIWKKMIELENVYFQWNPYGGRMGEIPASATPFPHRVGNLFLIQYLTNWENDTAEAEIKNMKAIRELHATFTPFVSRNPREAFLNYKDIEIGTNINGSLNFARDYFKDNVMRLLKVKAEVDPSNFFKYEQSIPIVPSNEEDGVVSMQVLENKLSN